MRVIASIPQDNLRSFARGAKAMEDAGYDVLMTLENKNEPFLPLGVAAVATERIGLATGVAVAFSRSPMTVANIGWDLQTASGGRFVLGLGPQVKGHNERRFSVKWSAPVPRLREYIEALRAIWRSWETGEKLDYQGEHYQFTLMTPNFTPSTAHLPPVPITIAAVGTHMLRLAGETCDGVRLHPFLTDRYLREESLMQVEQALAKSGRRRENFEVTCGMFMCTGPDDAAVRRMLEWARYRISFYGATRTYWPVFEKHGLHDLGEKLHRMSVEGKWDQMPKEVSDDVVELFTVHGTHKDLAGAIEKRLGGLVDAIYANLKNDEAPDFPSDLIQDIQRIPTPFRGYSTAW